MAPRRKHTKLDESFFAADADDVAQALLGTYLVRVFPNGSKVVGRIQEVAAYDGETKTSSDGMLYRPGTLTVSTKFGRHLIDIATGDNGQPSCVTLISGLFDWGNRRQLVQGPGNLSRALGIDREYDGRSINERDFWIESREEYNGEIRERSLTNRPANCQGVYYIREIE
jgi:3-methyladenine DNA glycosylase Mpg